MKHFSTTFYLFLLLSLLLVPLGVSAQVQRNTLATGENHSLSIHPDGTLWAWGGNGSGQLGDGTTTDRTVPVQIGTVTTWRSISAGYGFTLAVRTDGTLWAWGDNTYGQLGDGTTLRRTTPRQIGTATTWQSVGVGNFHSLAVRTDGTLWAWGSNAYSQLGDGGTTSRNTPVQVGTATNWQMVDAGIDFSLAVRTDGTLWSWGTNNLSQLGYNSVNFLMGQVGTATNWRSVSAGWSHGLAVRTDGTLWAWGNNTYNQLGDGTALRRNTPVQIGTATTWQSVSAGRAHSLALRADGTLWSWGYNVRGQLGDALTGQRAAPVQIGTATTWRNVSAGDNHTVGERTNGALWAWGYNGTGQVGSPALVLGQALTPQQIGTATTWNSVSTGGGHSLGIHSDGTLWGWGLNTYGEVGTGTTASVFSPVQIGTNTNWRSVSTGTNHTLAIQTDGSLWAWGNNYNGQLGDGAAIDRYSPIQIGTARDWQSVNAGESFSFAVRTNGTLWTWGGNSQATLGNGDPYGYTVYVPTQIGTATTWRTTSGSDAHALAIRTTGALAGWGDNTFGQIGDNSTAPLRRSPVTVAAGTTWQDADAGVSHSLAVRTDGTLWAWGSDMYGQRGNGTGTIGLAAPVQIGTATTWRSVSAAFKHSLGLRTDGTLWTWGANENGRLGDGTTTPHNTPVQLGTATNWQSIGTGTFNSVAVRTDGTLWAWGLNDYGQLGLPSSTNTPLLIFNPDGPLPVVLTAFTATPSAGTVRLAWATASEQQSAYFAVERSPDGQAFAPIGRVMAAGTSTAARKYDLTDANLPNGPVVYYRLKQVDADGSSIYSPVRSVLLSGRAGLSLYPNPAPDGAATLLGSAPGTRVQVLDVRGRVVLTTTADRSGSAVLALPAGLYVVRAGSAALRLSVQ